MGMGQGVRTGLGHGGITCALQTQFSSFFVFFFGGGRGGRQWNMAIYFKGTLENNSLFLGKQTNVWECLKRTRPIIKKIFVFCIPSYPHITPLPNTFYGTSWK